MPVYQLELPKLHVKTATISNGTVATKKALSANRYSGCDSHNVQFDWRTCLKELRRLPKPLTNVAAVVDDQLPFIYNKKQRPHGQHPALSHLPLLWNQAEQQSRRQRRMIKVCPSLDKSMSHQYTAMRSLSHDLFDSGMSVEQQYQRYIDVYCNEDTTPSNNYLLLFGKPVLESKYSKPKFH